MNKSTRESLGFLSFIALIVFAVSFLLSRLGANMSFFAWIGNGLLLIVVLALGKDYSNRLNNTWQVLYYVFAVLAVISYIWGFF